MKQIPEWHYHVLLRASNAIDRISEEITSVSHEIAEQLEGYGWTLEEWDALRRAEESKPE